MTVIPDYVIRQLVKENPLPLVTPFVEENLQPASIDLTLGEEFRVFRGHNIKAIDLNRPETFEHLTESVDVGETGEFILHPGEFVLGHTREKVNIPQDMIANMEGKSSLGRLGLIVHATAGFVDPGFCGRLTLEMHNLAPVPIILHPGNHICQVKFQFMWAKAERSYNGRYQNDDSVAASRYGMAVS